MQNKASYLIITSLLLGWLFDVLFWKQQLLGVSFAIYVCATLIAGFALLQLTGSRAAKWTLLLLPPILFFACMTFVRLEALSLTLAYLSTLLLMGVFVVTFQGGRWLQYGIVDYFVKAVDLCVSAIGRPLGYGIKERQAKPEAVEGEEVKKRSVNVWGVVRGLLLAIPVLAFFAALLSSADPVFAERIKSLTELLKIDNLPEYIFRVIYICVIAYGLSGIFLHAATRSQDEKLLGQEKPLLPAFFGFTEAAIVLGSVILLFGSFVTIQFQYFFGGQANIKVAGFTYAEYVHRGFGELVAVAFFALLLFVALSTVVKRETDIKRMVFSALGTLLFALVAVILASAYQRLVLYEAAYGFTRLRTYIHVFMVWVALLLAAVVVLDWLQRQRVFALVAVLAALGFAATLMLMNVDGFIASQNIARVAQGKELDTSYLASLSSDAVPTLVSFYQSPVPDAATHDKLGAALACFKAAEAATVQNQGQPSWQSFHLSNFWEQAGLAVVQDDLKAYTISSSDSGWRSAKTPLGKSYDCYGYFSD